MHIGDPAFDLGFSLTHFLSKAHYFPEKRLAYLELAGVYWREYANNRRVECSGRLEAAAVRSHTRLLAGARRRDARLSSISTNAHRLRQKHIVLESDRSEISLTIPDLIARFHQQLETTDGQN